MEANKTCTKCGKSKGVTEFFRDRRRADGRFPWCKKCHCPNMRDRTPEQVRRYYRSLENCRLKRVYGMSLEDYNRMLGQQGGACAICKNPPSKHKLSVDHNHSTGKVRGLLCVSCNFAIGALKEDSNLFHQAQVYLTERN